MTKLIKKFIGIAVVLALAGLFNPVAAQSGSEDKAVVNIIEYSDYQCPTCAYFHPIVEKIKSNFGARVTVDYRYFPLNSHQYAALAARAAQAAKNQGKFKQMHDLLFENQKRWSNTGNPTPILVNFARKIGLNIEEFKKDLNAAKTQKAVMKQKQEGIRRNVQATPTFFINGDKIQQLPRTYQDFEQLVQSYLSKAQSK